MKDISRPATLVLVVAVVTLLARHSLFAHEPALIAVQCLAAALMLWARWTFGMRSFHAAATPTAGGLVTTGPYRFLRHPIYSAILFFVWAGTISHPSVVGFGLVALASIALAVRMGTEERLVADRYPEYAAYAAGTKRVIPFLL
jgi:protein-S-isoprenylcysteine O-methyltransferase Ste14